MENLSLVIKSNTEQIYKYIKEFSPLVEDYDTEIIIINNEEVQLDLQYKHVVYEFEESYEKFYDFCYSVCTRDNIIIIEDGMNFDKNVLNLIKSIINSKETNIDCCIKQYISKDKYIIRNYRINSNRVSEDSEQVGFVIEDTSLLQCSNESIDKALNILCSQEKFSEIYTYYNEVILYKREELKKRFYVMLEKKKLELSIDAVELIEQGFINSDDNSNYSKYLAIKQGIENSDGNYEELISNIKNINLNEEDIYFSYILLKVFSKKVLVSEICKAIDLKLLYKYIEYLFYNGQDFYLKVYNYLLAINLSEEISLKENSNIEIYSYICKWYIEFMSEKSENIDDKQKLIQVFIDYTNYGFYLINQHERQKRKVILTNEIKFLQEVDKAINLINEKRIENAIRTLKKAVSNYKLMSRPVEYYIQRLRFENRQYPYKISICMIVKDEEKNIKRCLNSLMPLVNSKLAELIVVDTGSSDKTVELARKYVKEVYFHKWQGNFSEARNYSISLAQGEYIFIMDADEEIEGEELAKISDSFNSNSYREYNTFSFKIKNYSDESYKKFSVFTQNLIFKNDGTFYYSGSVHNQPVYKLPIKNIDCTILHYGYIMTEDIKDKKFVRTSTLLKKELEKNPKNIYYRFQLSVSYSMHGDLQESLEQAKIYMKLLKEKKDAVKDNLMYYNNAALVYTNNRLFREAIEISDEALAVQPDFIDFIYYKGDGYFELEEYEKSISYLKEYLELLDEFHMHKVMQDDRYLFYSLDSRETAKGLITAAYSKVGQYEECINSNKAIKDTKIFRNTLYSVIDSYFKLDDAEGIVEFYKENIYNHKESDLKEIFKYYFEENLLSMTEEKQKKYILTFVQSELDDDYVDILRFNAGKGIEQNTHRILNFINKYDIDETDTISGNMIIETILPILLKYNIDTKSDIKEIKVLKQSAEFVLHRSLNLSQYSNLSKDELLQILDKYISICEYAVRIGREDLLEEVEVGFISNVLNALEQLKNNNMIKCIAYIRDSVSQHKKMAKAMELFLETIIPSYKSADSILKNKTNYDFKKQIKHIENLISNGFYEEALDMLNKYACTSPKEIEIYSMKAIIFIMKGDLKQAENIILQGLVLEPNNFDLLMNYSYLSHCSGKYGKSIEVYSKAKLLAPNNNILIKDIIPDYKFIAKENIKIIHGPIEIANQMHTITEALRSQGVDADTINYYPNYLNYKSHNVIDISKFNNQEHARAEISNIAAKYIAEKDIFHFHFGMSLTLDNSDLPILKELGKKVFMQHWGSDVRLLSIASKNNPFVKVKNIDEKSIRNQLAYISKHVTSCIVSDYELLQYVKDYYEKVYLIRQAVNISEYEPKTQDEGNKKLLIVHAPTSSNVKGTQFVLKAIESLRLKYDFDFKLIEGMSHSEAKKIYQKADIILDQLLFGSYGLLAVEAMSMGKPVICYISDYLRDTYPKELPIISANPINVETKLEYLIRNRDCLKEVGEKGRQYVKKYHDVNIIAKQLYDLYISKLED